jgi:hypothetical protein
MKKIIIIALIIAGGFAACKKDKKDDDNSSSSSSTTGSTGSYYVTTKMTNGKWKVSNFSTNGNNETQVFYGYAFQFNSNGTVFAVREGRTDIGGWSMVTNDGQNELNIKFPLAPLDELNEDWHVKEMNSNLVILEHTNGDDGGTETLELQKI